MSRLSPLKIILLFLPLIILSQVSTAQIDANNYNYAQDSSVLRIKNINPFFLVHVDSIVNYQFEINKPVEEYYWYVKNAPAGLKLNKDNGFMSIDVNKSFFLSGKLKYDRDYKVNLTVQNLNNANDRLDTSFVINFFSTEIIASSIKPSVTDKLFMEEGDTLSFQIQCENGSFPLTDITYLSNYAIKSMTPITKCGDFFTWPIPYEFVKSTDKDNQRQVSVYFVGTTKFKTADTAVINVLVRKSINYPEQVKQNELLRNEIELYIRQLKSSFRIVDKRIRRTKKTRTSFDLASASTALGGTIFSSMPNSSQQTVGKILPSIGVALVPVKEATAPNSSYEQNTATLIRSAIKRLEYLLANNRLTGERDPDIILKSRKLRDELTQTQVQLIDAPIGDDTENVEELDNYFNSPKVNKKYRLKKN